MKRYLIAITILFPAIISAQISSPRLKPAATQQNYSTEQLRERLIKACGQFEQLNDAEWTQQVDRVAGKLKKNRLESEAKALNALKSGRARQLAVKALKTKINDLSSNGIFLILDIVMWLDGDPFYICGDPPNTNPACECLMHLLLWVGTLDATQAENY